MVTLRSAPPDAGQATIARQARASRLARSGERQSRIEWLLEEKEGHFA
jgi:hypothetical protein